MTESEKLDLMLLRIMHLIADLKKIVDADSYVHTSFDQSTYVVRGQLAKIALGALERTEGVVADAVRPPTTEQHQTSAKEDRPK